MFFLEFLFLGLCIYLGKQNNNNLKKMQMKKIILSVVLLLVAVVACLWWINKKDKNEQAEDKFVKVVDGHFQRNGKPYYYVGTNFWYGAILGSEGRGGNRPQNTRGKRRRRGSADKG